MQRAVNAPYRDFLANSAPPYDRTGTDGEGRTVKSLIKDSAVVVFARKGCCMCHVVKLLLHCHGVSPVIFDVDEENEAEVRAGDVAEMIAGEANFPAVFVGGEWFGGLEEVIRAHISGELVPKLREARALWL